MDFGHPQQFEGAEDCGGANSGVRGFPRACASHLASARAGGADHSEARGSAGAWLLAGNAMVVGGKHSTFLLIVV